MAGLSTRTASSSKNSRILAFLLLILCLSLLIPARAVAAPADDSADAFTKGVVSASKEICNEYISKATSFIPDEAQKSCSKELAKYLQENQGWTSTLDSLNNIAIGKLICTPAQVLPVLGSICTTLVTPLAPNIKNILSKVGVQTIAKVNQLQQWVEKAKFILDPETQLEKIVNSLYVSAGTAYTAVLREVVEIGDPDLQAPWWRDSYAAAGGLGLLVASFLLLFLCWDAASSKISPSQFVDGIKQYAVSLLMIVFAPPVAIVLLNVSNGMSKGVVTWGGKDSLDVLLKLAIFTNPATALLGGWIVGLFLLLMLLIGCLLLLASFIIQGLAVYLSSIAMGIGLGFRTHPRWRHKALAFPLICTGLIFTKPVLLFGVMCMTKLINNYNPISSAAGGPLKLLTDTFIVGLGVLLLGLSPLILLTIFKVLPTGSEMMPTDINPASATAGAAAGVMGAKIASDRMGMFSGGGGGGGRSSTANNGGGKSTAPGGGGSGGSGGGGSSSVGAGSSAGASPSPARVGGGGGGGGGKAAAGGAGALFLAAALATAAKGAADTGKKMGDSVGHAAAPAETSPEGAVDINNYRRLSEA
ncbi:hypothetical protein ACUH95_07475 [Dermabacteraceae bacterium P13101]